jgi:transposase-like protein
LTGPDGLLKSITKQVIESALEEEMSEYVGYDKHALEDRNGGNSRNGTRSKPVPTDNAGEVQIEVAAGYWCHDVDRVDASGTWPGRGTRRHVREP